jgi:hypothetical protein
LTYKSPDISTIKRNAGNIQFDYCIFLSLRRMRDENDGIMKKLIGFLTFQAYMINKKERAALIRASFRRLRREKEDEKESARDAL